MSEDLSIIDQFIVHEEQVSASNNRKFVDRLPCYSVGYSKVRRLEGCPWHTLDVFFLHCIKIFNPVVEYMHISL